MTATVPVRMVMSRDALREALGDAHPGFVPTMGSLHDGHTALIARAAAENALTVVSIFVNPTQFSCQDDLARYPRDLERDAALAADSGATLLFAPDVEEIYPPGFATTVEVGRLGQVWEGASRPGHFRGVATVVTILMNLVRPRRTYFGEKDYQQLQIIRRIQRDLALPGDIVACATVRDDDGLALSSRNRRLSAAQRKRALAIPRTIAHVIDRAAAGETDVKRLETAGLAELNRPGVRIDYLAVVDGETLEPTATLQPGARVLVAAEIGGVHLIDNAAVAPAPRALDLDPLRLPAKRSRSH
jgi:pantoate--beta-alanine ligase